MAQRAMPPWTAVEADVDVVCRLHQRIANVFPVETLDIVVVGIFHQVGDPSRAVRHVCAMRLVSHHTCLVLTRL